MNNNINLKKKNIINSMFLALVLLLIAVTVGLNNIVIGYKIAGISIDRFIQIFLFLLLFKQFIKDLNDKNLRFVEAIILCFLVLASFNGLSLIIQGEEKITLMLFVRDTIRVLMYGVFTYLAYYLLSNDIKKLNIILFIQFLAILLAFLQNPMTPLTDWSQSVKLEYFANNMMTQDIETYRSFMKNVDWSFIRVSGPYGQVITFSYTLVTSAILTTFMYIHTNKKIYISYLLFIFLVSIMSLTRSAIGGVFIMLLFLVLKEKIYLYILLTIGVLYILYMLFFGNFDPASLGDYSSVISTEERSGGGRIYLWLTGIAAITMHPFGVTEIDYMNIKEFMYSIYYDPSILHYSSHNGIISLGFQYTILGIFLFILFIFGLFKMSKVLERKEKKFWLFAFLAYFFQQSFHNNGIFYVEFNVLIVLALYLVDLNINGERGRGSKR